MRAVVLALAVVACGGQTKQIETAKRARYDADLSVLVAETAEVLRGWYKTIEVDPQGVIRTPWHEVRAPGHHDPLYTTRTGAERAETWRRHFVRFHVAISPTRPSRIDVTCHAAVMQRDRDEAPVEYARDNEPRWTSAFADKLRLEIHAKLERFAR